MRTVYYIVGISCSGKTTAARRLASQLNLRLYHADLVYNQLHAKYGTTPPPSRLVDYRKWKNPRSFGIESWGDFKNIEEAKAPMFEGLIVDKSSDFIIEGFTLSFISERKHVEKVVGPHNAVIIRIDAPFCLWKEFFLRKKGKSAERRRDSYDRLRSCFAAQEGDTVHTVSHPDAINGDLVQRLGFKSADEQVDRDMDAASSKRPQGPQTFQANVDPSIWLQGARNDMERLFYSHSGRPVRKWHHYLEIYDRHMSWFLAERRARNESDPVRFLEIGVSRGGSLQLWRKYFGPSAIIYGVDIDSRCRKVADADVEVRIGSQDDPAFLQSVLDEMGGVDIVVDDGSHRASHQRASFDVLFPALSPHGLYICEDLHTAYWPKFEGGLKRPGTFCELVKDMVDWLHAWYVPLPQRQRHSFSDRYGFATGVLGVSIYDSIAVIEKRPKERPFQSTMPQSKQSRPDNNEDEN